MRVWSGFVAVIALTALAGCKAIERWAKDRDRPASADAASRTRDPAQPPPNWLNNNSLPGGKSAAIPTADSHGDPRDPNYDLRSEVKGLLAGVVVDADNRGVPYLDIQIEAAEAVQTGGAPVSVQTDRNGYFLIRGLKPGQSYSLTAQAKQGGRVLAGQSVARAPSPHVRIQLREDVALPGGKGGADLPPSAGKGGMPGGQPSLFDGPTTRPPARADAASPQPVPLSKDTGSLPYPAETPARDGAFSPVPSGETRPPAIGSPQPPALPRTDLVAPGPPLPKPPVANIPGPTPTPASPPSQPEVLPPPPLPPSTSKFAPKGSARAFQLVDPLGRPREFPSGRGSELILLDFMTTTCAPCVRAVPALTALQSKYGAHGFEVVAVACDDASESERRSLAARYADDHRLNYLVYAEPGTSPGAVMKQFGVKVFPTLVLVDGAGSIVWQGRPAELSGLERAIREAESRRN